MPRGRGRPPKEESEQARDRLLEAARDLFSERGFAATPVSAICERAGVAKPALYWHFGNKEGLLSAVLESSGSLWIGDLQKRTASLGDPGDRLTGLVEEWKRIILEHPQQLRLPLIAQLEQGESSAQAREAVHRLRERAERVMVDEIAHATPGLDLADLDLLAFVAVTLLQGAMLRHTDVSSEEDLDRVLGEVRRTLSLLIWDRLSPDLRRSLVDSTGAAAVRNRSKPLS